MKQGVDWVGIKVCKTRCTECLYTKDRIVSGRAAADVLKECAEKDTFFQCHKHEDVVMCRGFYDANPKHHVIQVTQAMSAAHETDYFLFVNADERTY